MKIYDITAKINDSLPVYGGKRPAVIKLVKIEEGAAYNFSRIEATTHTGTHADMPSHFIDGSATCDTIALDYFYGRAKLIRIQTRTHITKADLARHEIPAGIILLIDTGQSMYMSKKSLHENFIALTPEAAQYLVEKQVKTVGIDYLSIDPYGDDDFPVHKILLGNNICALEGLVLAHVPEGEYTISALPLNIEDGDGSPVRAILVTL